MIRRIRWMPKERIWEMSDEDDDFIESFKGCKNFRRKYPGLSKDGVNVYDDPPATKIGEEELNGE